MKIKFHFPILEYYDPADRFYESRLPFEADGISGCVEIVGGAKKVYVFQEVENLEEISEAVLNRFAEEVNC